MSKRKRLILEISVALLLVVICRTLWRPAHRRYEGVKELQSRHETAIEQIRQACEERAEMLADSEAEAVFRAFAAGIEGSVMQKENERLLAAKGRLLRMPYVAFSYLLAPDGEVLTGSTETYTVAGPTRLSSWSVRSSWALEATTLRARPGDLPGTTELAAPLQGTSGGKVILWLGYRTQDLLVATRD